MSCIAHIKKELNIALVQFAPEWKNAAANRAILSSMFGDLDENIDLIVLPEAFATGFSMDASDVAEPMTRETVNWMKQVACNYNTVICGSIFISDGNRFYNRFLWITPDGEILHYDKRHLFSVGGEHNSYFPGNNRVLIEYKGWRIFPQICYDLRFPVWCRNNLQYDIMINVANWPAPRHDVWQTLLKARAIENQCYVIGVNRLGIDENNVIYRGDSVVIDARGVIKLDAKDQLGISYYSVRLDKLHSFRRKFDALSDADEFIFNF